MRATTYIEAKVLCISALNGVVYALFCKHNYHSSRVEP